MKSPATAGAARVTEIFSSLQGEGVYAGAKHVFVRFEECHMHCGYCDELHKIGREWTQDQVFDQIMRLEKEKGPHQHISFTGGEPLLYLPFLKPLILRLKSAGLAVYLETSGVLWKSLADIVGACDVVAMDLKPASVTGEKSFLEEHRNFLRLSLGTNYFLKMVVSKHIDFNEFDALVKMSAEISPDAVLFLQPVTGKDEGHDDAQLMRLILELQQRGQKWLKDIRIGLRLHRILNIR